MAFINQVQANGSDTAFKITGFAFGAYQGLYNGLVAVSNSTGSHSNATISSWTDTQITGTLPTGYKPTTGFIMVLVDVPDQTGNVHRVASNHAVYTLG